MTGEIQSNKPGRLGRSMLRPYMGFVKLKICDIPDMCRQAAEKRRRDAFEAQGKPALSD
jgi:hypothetical protein